jgi:radical SAM protein with 4Fe4S-binding SPASM domain
MRGIASDNNSSGSTLDPNTPWICQPCTHLHRGSFRLNGHPLDRVAREPHTCIFEITRRCNLRCIHCENHCGEVSRRELSTERIRCVARELVQLGCHTSTSRAASRSCIRIGTTVSRLAGVGLRTALITNGTLLDEERLDRALDAGVAAVGISLDGLQATHDSIRLRPGAGPSPWRETVAAIERALPAHRNHRHHRGQPTNLAELPALRDHLAGLGVRRWQIQLVIPMGRALEGRATFVIAPADLETLTAFLVEARASGKLAAHRRQRHHRLLHRARIGPARLRGRPVAVDRLPGRHRSVAITYDGRVRGCSMMPPEFDAGDLHDESMTTIWNDAERFAYSTRFDAAKLAGPCGRCRVGPLCRAGCTTMAYWTTGSIYTNPFCLHRVRGVAHDPIARALRRRAGADPALPVPMPDLRLARGCARARELDHGEWLGVIGALADLGCRRITLMGGEPLLYPRWVELAGGTRARHARRLDQFGPGPRREDALRMRESGLHAVTISVDGLAAPTMPSDGCRAVSSRPCAPSAGSTRLASRWA